MMRGRSLVPLFLLVTAAFVLVSPATLGQAPSTEALDIVFIGSSAYWRLELQRGNLSFVGLPDAEAGLSGVEAYNLTVTRVQEWRPEHELFSQVFASDLVPRVAPGGAFLEVRANSEAEAVDAASRLEPLGGLNFVLLEADPPNFRFYSHADFARLVRRWVLPALTGLDGFARLATEDSLLAPPLAAFQLAAQSDGQSFERHLSLGAVRSGTLSPERPGLAQVFPNAVSVNASQDSAGSRIGLKVVGGIVTGAEGVQFASAVGDPVAEASLTLSPGARLPLINVTVGTALPSIVATREVDRGAAVRNETLEIRIRLRNVGSPGAPAAENVTVAENWWRPWFDFVEGNSSVVLPSIAPGQTEVVVYELRVRVADAVETQQSAAQNRISYGFRLANTSFAASAVLNELPLVLNAASPAVRIEAIPASASPPLGAPANVTLNVVNAGTRTAFTLRVSQGGTTVGIRDSLAPGETWSTQANATQPLRTSLNMSLQWQVSWLAEGQEKRAASNDVRLYHSSAAVQLPNPELAKTVEVLNRTGTTYANVSLTATNVGAGRASSLVLKDALPEGTSYVNGSAPLVDREVVASHPALAFGENTTWWYLLALANPRDNYVLPPAELSYGTGGETFVRLSPSAVLPLGIEINQTLSGHRGLVTMALAAQARATNHGSRPIFDVQLTGGTGDLVRLGSGNATAAASIVAASQSLEASFSLQLVAEGTENLTAPTVQFLFGGVTHQKTGELAPLTVYALPSVTLATTPAAPVEDRPFLLSIAIQNPSDFELRDIRVRVSIPPGLNLVEGEPEYTLAVLEPMGEAVRELTLITADPLDVSLPAPTVSFRLENTSLAARSTAFTIAVGDDVPLRYAAPLGIAAALAVGAIIALRRRIFKTPPSSPPVANGSVSRPHATP